MKLKKQIPKFQIIFYHYVKKKENLILSKKIFILVKKEKRFMKILDYLLV